MRLTESRTTITLAGAAAVIEAVIAAAEDEGVRLGVSVVNGDGVIIATARMDGAQLPALDLAYNKAYTAVAFSAPSDAFAASTLPGHPDWGMNGSLEGRLLTMAGGIPLILDGTLVGAVGVSGAPGAVDRRCAESGASALARRLSAS